MFGQVGEQLSTATSAASRSGTTATATPGVALEVAGAAELLLVMSMPVNSATIVGP